MYNMPSIVLASLILLAFFAQFYSCTLPELKFNLEVEHLSAAATRIIREYYSKQAKGLSVICWTMNPSASDKQSEIVNLVGLRTRATIGLVIENQESFKSTPFLRFEAIFFFDGYDAFRQFYGEITVERIDYAGEFTIILTESIELTKVTEIFEDLWEHRIININVLLFDATEKRVIAYTYFPFTPLYCEQIHLGILMYMNNYSIDLRNQLFPNKVRNLYGCELIMASYSVPPYTITEKLQDGTYKTKGIEIDLYRELASRLNFGPTIRVVNVGENFELLRKVEVNLTIGAIVNTVERSEEFTATFPYTYASLVFTIPHGPPFTPLEKLMLPFGPIVWLCVLFVTGVALMLVVFMSCCSKKCRDFVFGERNKTPFLNYINVTLGGAITRSPVRNFARFILMVWMVCSLVLRSSYTGAMFSFIQSQQSAVEIDSLEKLVQYNFSIYSSAQIIRLLENSTIFSGDRRNILKLPDDGDMMEKLKKPGTHGTFITTLDVIGYHNQQHQTEKIRASKERIFLLPLSIFMSKHSFLEQIINHQIELFTTNGLIEKWSNVYREKQTIIKTRPKEPPKKLKLIEVSGAYQLCAFFYGMSALLFIAEVVSLKVRYLRRLFDHV